MLTRYRMMSLLSQHLLLNGEGFWNLDGRIKASKAPTIIGPMNPAHVDQVLNEDGTLSRYVYRNLVVIDTNGTVKRFVAIHIDVVVPQPDREQLLRIR